MEKEYLYNNDCDILDAARVHDYIHVADLCSAHVKALGRLRRSGWGQRGGLAVDE